MLTTHDTAAIEISQKFPEQIICSHRPSGDYIPLFYYDGHVVFVPFKVPFKEEELLVTVVDGKSDNDFIPPSASFAFRYFNQKTVLLGERLVTYEKAKKELEAKGGKLLPITCRQVIDLSDLSDDEKIIGLVKATIADILDVVTNANQSLLPAFSDWAVQYSYVVDAYLSDITFQMIQGCIVGLGKSKIVSLSSYIKPKFVQGCGSDNKQKVSKDIKGYYPAHVVAITTTYTPVLGQLSHIGTTLAEQMFQLFNIELTSELNVVKTTYYWVALPLVHKSENKVADAGGVVLSSVHWAWDTFHGGGPYASAIVTTRGSFYPFAIKDDGVEITARTMRLQSFVESLPQFTSFWAKNSAFGVPYHLQDGFLILSFSSYTKYRYYNESGVFALGNESNANKRGPAVFTLHGLEGKIQDVSHDNDSVQLELDIPNATNESITTSITPKPLFSYAVGPSDVDVTFILPSDTVHFEKAKPPLCLHAGGPCVYDMLDIVNGYLTLDELVNDYIYDRITHPLIDAIWFYTITYMASVETVDEVIRFRKFTFNQAFIAQMLEDKDISRGYVNLGFPFSFKPPVIENIGGILPKMSLVSFQFPFDFKGDSSLYILGHYIVTYDVSFKIPFTDDGLSLFCRIKKDQREGSFNLLNYISLRQDIKKYLMLKNIDVENIDDSSFYTDILFWTYLREEKTFPPPKASTAVFYDRFGSPVAVHIYATPQNIYVMPSVSTTLRSIPSPVPSTILNPESVLPYVLNALNVTDASMFTLGADVFIEHVESCKKPTCVICM